uniref:NADH-ubiquinone oxidoreductase chain 2 n=1 Tax=Parvasolenaia rivularis TaxID=1491190 RepID=A0A3G1GHK4_9BIVA|nr:NADH dehydrogenase subunit 2 [Parvasolenaia rivularis]
MKTKMPTFSLMLMMSTLLATMSTNTLLVWMMLELNMLTFIPLMTSNNSTTETESSIKYLIPQMFASGLFMTSILMATVTPNSNILSTVALITKLGGAPLHAWFPTVMQSTNLNSSFILATWQKLAPTLLLTNPQLSHTPMMTFFAVVSALWGSLAGLNQTNLLKLMAFSSISHLGWLLIASMFNSVLPLIYLMSYSMSALPIFMHMQNPHIKTYNTTTLSPLNNYTQTSFIVSMLSLAGLPPLAMFLNKLPIIILMTSTTSLLTPLIALIVSTMISLYFYLSLAIMMTLNSTSKQTTKTTLSNMKSTMYAISMMFQCSALPLWLTTQTH